MFRKKEMLLTIVAVTLVLVMTFVSISFVSSQVPSGAVPSSQRNETFTPDNSSRVDAIAGNVSEVNFHSRTVTQSWQGYFGNVTGVIVLGDTNQNIMYNWSVASPRGQIYASTNNTVVWQYIQCFNFTADGTYNAADLNYYGNTSLHGTNLTLLQEEFGVQSRDDDSVNNTFRWIGAQGHSVFYTNNYEFSKGECQTTRVFGPDGSQNEGEFEQVLLYEPSTSSVVFVSLLEEDRLGFDNVTHDFQMLVLEDGHGTDIQTTPYYFWVALQ